MKMEPSGGTKIPVAEPELGEAELANVVQAVQSGWISSQGEFVRRFESEFARYCGTAYGVATSNGTTALHLALAALGVGPGDEVVVPALTFVATANAVAYTGARPVFVDADPDYWCMNPDRLAEKITPRTRGIIPVHLFGHPCDMDPILDIARRHGLWVVEDAAEAHGAEYRGSKVGSFGVIGCFSFYANKIITTGEGGMCVTSDDGLYQRMLILRDHGMTPGQRYWHDTIGFNYRMTNLQAAVGVAQLDKLDTFVERKRALARLYGSLLDGIPAVRLPAEMPWAKHVQWMYSILLTDDFLMNGEDLARTLDAEGIETRPFFTPLHLLPPYRDGTILPESERLWRQGISLPSSVGLTRQQAEYVAAALRRAAT